MKKYLMAAFALLMCGSAMALENEPKQGATVMGFLGMNATHITNTDFGGKVGGTFGARIDYVLPKAHGTYLTAGVDWTLKGGKDKESVMGAPGYSEYTNKACLHYMEVPVRVGFRYNLSKEIGFYGEVGPYFAVGVGGKNKLNIDADGAAIAALEDAGTYKIFKNSDNYERPTFQRWDCGVGFRVGAEYNQHYNLMLGCDWGITDMYREKYRNAFFDHYQQNLGKAHNFNFTLAIGYRF